MVSKVLTGALDTPEGHAAIAAAVDHVQAAGGELHLVGFVERPKGDAKMESYRDDVAGYEEQVSELASRLVPSDVPVRAHVPTGVGHPSEAILRIAAQEQPDLIVIGMRKRSRVGKLVMGSNAQDILLGAPCPVLSVRAPESDS